MSGIKIFSPVWMFLFLVFLACSGGSEKKEIRQLSSEVIALHDEVMPLMDSLYKVRKQLQKEIQADSSDIELFEAITDIELAEEAMMNWMRNYEPNFEGKNDTETLNYLVEQKISIKRVAGQINKALAVGHRVIDDFN